MSTLSRGRGAVFGHRHEVDLPLAEFPAWGVEVMMGLYGQQTILDAREAEAHSVSTRRRLRNDGIRRAQRPIVGVGAGRAEPVSEFSGYASDGVDNCGAPVPLQLDAVTELARYIERRFRRP